jgi:hypothetical protein
MFGNQALDVENNFLARITPDKHGVAIARLVKLKVFGDGRVAVVLVQLKLLADFALGSVAGKSIEFLGWRSLTSTLVTDEKERRTAFRVCQNGRNKIDVGSHVELGGQSGQRGNGDTFLIYIRRHTG